MTATIVSNSLFKIKPNNKSQGSLFIKKSGAGGSWRRWRVVVSNWRGEAGGYGLLIEENKEINGFIMSLVSNYSSKGLASQSRSSLFQQEFPDFFVQHNILIHFQTQSGVISYSAMD